MAVKKRIWLGILLALGLALEAECIRFAKELALRAHFRKMGIISQDSDQWPEIDPVHDNESAENKSELQKRLDEGAFYQQIPVDLHFVNKFPKTASHLNVPQPPSAGPEKEYDEFCRR